MNETLAERLRQITAVDNDEADVLFDAADLIEELQDEIERLRAREARLREALEGVIRIADRDCPEFRAARAALAEQEKK